MSGGTLNESNYIAIGRNSATGTLNLSGGTINKTGSGTITLAGIGTTQTGTINMTGGTVIDTAGATYIGETGIGVLNISGGAYNMNTGSAFSSFGLNAGSKGTVTISGGAYNDNANVDTNIGDSGTGILSVNGTGVYNAGTGTNFYLARQTVSNGTLNLGNFTTSGTATGTSAAPTDGEIKTVGIVAGLGTKTVNFDGGILLAAAAGNLDNVTSNVLKGGLVIDDQAFASTLTGALVHGGTGTDGGLTKNGTGTLTVSGANTYTGPTNINAGTFTVATGGTLGAAASATNDNAALSFTGTGSTTFANVITGAGTLTQAGTGTTILTGTNTYTGATAITAGTLQIGNGGTAGTLGTYTGAIADAGTLAFDLSTPLTLNNVVSGAGGITQGPGSSLTIGALTLNGVNTFTGGVNISSGSLIATNSASLGTGTKTITIANGTAGNDSLHLNGSAGSVNLPSSFTYNVSNTTGVFYNDAGTNSIAGQINITAGGGGLTIESDAGTLNVAANITATTTGRAIVLQGASNGTVSGVISNGSTVGLPITKAGTGTWQLSGLNIYTGATTVNAGTLQAGIGQSGTTGAFGNNSAAVLANVAGATLDLNSFNETVGSLSGGGTTGGNVTLGTGTLTTGGLNAAATYGGVISDGGLGGGLTKTGTGTLTLTNASTYTGATNINAGTLALNDSGTNTGALGSTAVTAVTVASGATLLAQGNATISGTGSVTSGGTTSLQDTTINTLTVGGGLNLNASTLNFDLGTGTADEILAGGAATETGTNTINLDLLTGQTITSGNYTLISDAAGGLGSGFALGTAPAGFNQYTLANSTSTAEILTINANPAAAIEYWTGAASRTISDAANNFSDSAGGFTQSNFSTDKAGTVDALQVPESNTDLVFTATNATPSSGSTLTTTLDAAYGIKGLTFGVPSSTGITSTVINTNGNALTIGADGVTVASAADPSNPNASSGTISGTGSVILNGSQSFANNNSALGLTVSTGITGFSGATTLTLNGTDVGGVTLSGVIGNGTASSLGLNFNQAGVTTVSGANTYTGGTVINSGTVQTGNVAALGSATNSALTFGAGSTGILQLNGTNLTVSDLNTNATTVGTPIIQSGSATAGSDTFTVNTANTDAFGGVLQNGGTRTLSLAKSGAGTLTLTGTNTYTGATTISAGTLQLGDGTTDGSIANTSGVANNGTFVYNLVGNRAPTYAITGTGTTTKLGAGTLTFAGTTNTQTSFFERNGTTVVDTGATVASTGYSSIGLASGDNATLTVQNTGKYTASTDLNVSDLLGSTGTLNVSGTATVSGTTVYIGKTGTGTANITGGSVTSTGNSSVGTNSTGVGTLNLSAGSYTAKGDFDDADGTGGTGTVNVSGTGLLTVNTLYVGKGSAANTGAGTLGTVNQTGGTVAEGTVVNDWRIGGGNASDSAATGVYNLSGGTVSTGANFQIGAYGIGTFNQTGGTATFTNEYPVVGRYAGSNGTLNVSAGNFNQTGTGNKLIVGEDGIGVATVSGTGVITSTGGLTEGLTATGNGTFNLGTGAGNGGLLNTVFITGINGIAGNSVGSSTFNFNGGTLQVAAANIAADNAGFFAGISPDQCAERRRGH